MHASERETLQKVQKTSLPSPHTQLDTLMALFLSDWGRMGVEGTEG